MSRCQTGERFPLQRHRILLQILPQASFEDPAMDYVGSRIEAFPWISFPAGKPRLPHPGFSSLYPMWEFGILFCLSPLRGESSLAPRGILFYPPPFFSVSTFFIFFWFIISKIEFVYFVNNFPIRYFFQIVMCHHCAWYILIFQTKNNFSVFLLKNKFYRSIQYNIQNQVFKICREIFIRKSVKE